MPTDPGHCKSPFESRHSVTYAWLLLGTENILIDLFVTNTDADQPIRAISQNTIMEMCKCKK